MHLVGFLFFPGKNDIIWAALDNANFLVSISMQMPYCQAGPNQSGPNGVYII